jgi:NOL1/NOP2/fmu family ribosome biogenesis protein
MRKLLSDNDSLKVKKFMATRFGLTLDYFKGYIFYTTKKSVWMARDQYYSEINQNLKIESIGLRIISGKLNEHMINVKPTTQFSQMLTGLATLNVIELEANNLKKYCQRDRVEIELKNSKGYVMISYKGNIVGCGFYSNNTINSHYPRGLVQYIHTDTII